LGAVLVLAGVLAGIGWYWQDTRSAGADPADSESPRAALSIVVLPFVNRTGDPENEYFADGITESLTADLGRIQQAFVVNTATAFAYKNKPTNAQQVGKELGVRYVLQGSVQRSGDKIRINAQLADTKTNAQLWTEVFESDLSDLFALQDQVTTRISNSIERKMIVLAARESLTRKTTPKVADLILRARALRLKRHALANFQQAEALYRQVLAIEPDNSIAMAELSWALAIQASNFGGSLDKAVAEAKFIEGRDIALKAQAIDPDNPDLYLAIAFYARAHDDYAGYLRASETRYRLHPKNPSAPISLAVTYLWGGTPLKAIKYLNLAHDLDPKRNLFLIPLNICRAYIMLGENDKAIENCLKAIEFNPRFAVNYFFLAIAYAVKGDDARMVEAVTELHKIAPNFRMTHLPQPSSPDTYKEYFENIQIPAARKAGLIE
jgi:TolB-like protein